MSSFAWQCFILYRQQNSKRCGPLCTKSLKRDISKAHADDNDCLSQKTHCENHTLFTCYSCTAVGFFKVLQNLMPLVSA